MNTQLDGARICIVMMSALGDAVHVLPIICAIKRHAPASRITWVLEPAGAKLMSGHPLVDEVIVHRKGASALCALRRAMRGKRFDVLLNLQVAMKAGLTTLVIPADRKIGFDRARARDLNWLFTNARIAPHTPQHVQDQYFEFLDFLGVPHGEPEWLLGPWPGEEQLLPEELRTSERRLVGLAIATSWPEKDWVPGRWAALADELYGVHGLQPVLLGGRSQKEAGIAQEIAKEASAPVLSTLGCSLRELVSVISACSLVISPDTAPLHMSVALNVPVIALMGYTNPLRVGPYRRFHELMVDAYTDPGEVNTPKLEYRDGRMERITVQHVLDRVKLWEREYADGRTGSAVTH